MDAPRISHVIEQGSRVDIVEGEVRLDNWGAIVAIPRFKQPPKITVSPYSRPTFDETGPVPEILNVTRDSFELKAQNSSSAITWKWEARGTLKHVEGSNTPGERRWLRADKIALWSVVVAILLGVLAFFTPDVRVWLHLDKPKPPEVTAPTTGK